MPRDLIPSRRETGEPKVEISQEIEMPQPTVSLNKEAQWAAALAAATARTPEETRAAHFEQAKQELGRLTIAQAVDLLRTLPIGLLEMYLLAEEATQAREAILQSFPKPSPEARAMYGVKAPRKYRRMKQPVRLAAAGGKMTVRIADTEA